MTVAFIATPTEAAAEAEVVLVEGRSVVSRLRSSVPVGLRETGGDGSVARLALVQSGAVLLAGDQIEVRITVGPGARAAVSDISATLVHEAAEGVPPAVQAVNLEVGRGGRAVLLEQPLIIAARARMHRRVRIDLAAEAKVLHRDSLVLGRAGEQPGEARVRTRVERAGRPLLDETLDTSSAMTLRDPAVLGGARVLAGLALYGSTTCEPPPDDAFQIGPEAVLLRRLAADWRSLEMDALEAAWTREVLG